jgi:DNA-binding GntR family transcriptional regulator
VVVTGTSQASLTTQAYDLLEEKLVTGELAPGMLLSEKDLVEITGIGRTPVREAIQRLASDGLIHILPRKGLMVTTVNRVTMRQLLETRRVLERLAAESASERADDKERSAFTELAAGIGGSGSDPAAFFRLDRQLDQIIGVACGNPCLVRALAPLHSQCRRFSYQYRTADDIEQACKLHAELAGRIASGDKTGATIASDGIIDLLERRIMRVDELH